MLARFDHEERLAIQAQTELSGSCCRDHATGQRDNQDDQDSRHGARLRKLGGRFIIAALDVTSKRGRPLL